MAHEKNKPRNGLILFFAVLSVVVLVMLQPVFNSYFNSITETERERKNVDESDQWKSLREKAEKTLSDGPTSIDVALRKLSAGVREKIVVPRPSDDESAAHGWAHHPDYVAPQVAGPTDTSVEVGGESQPQGAPAQGTAAESPRKTPERPVRGGEGNPQKTEADPPAAGKKQAPLPGDTEDPPNEPGAEAGAP